MRAVKLSALVLILMLAVLACRQESSELPPTGPVNGPTGQALMEQLGVKLLVLDVRTPEEFEQGHVPGALNIDVRVLESRMAEVPVDRPILVLCLKGVRAEKAYDMILNDYPDLPAKGFWFLKSTPEYQPDGAFKL